jgi:hypothetical protein
MKKLLILMLLGACGKHQAPDIHEVNLFGHNTYITQAATTPEVEGTLSFAAGELHEKIHIFKLNNQWDLKKAGLEALTHNLNIVKNWKYLSDKSLLKMEKLPLPELVKGSYEITLDINASDKDFKDLYLARENGLEFIMEWQPGKTFRLTKNQLISILNNESHLALSAKDKVIKVIGQDDTYPLERETYRVFFHDGKEGTILYVSNKMKFDSLIKELTNHQVKFFQAEKAFFYRQQDGLHWWIREEAHFKVLVYATATEVHEAYLQSFKKLQLNVDRLNGTAIQPGLIKKHHDAKVLLKIRHTKIDYIFKAKVKKINDCKFTVREISGQKKVVREVHELISEVILSSPEKIEKATYLFGHDSLGPYLELIVDARTEDLKIALRPLEKSFYLPAVIDSKCKNSNIKLLSPEKQLSLKIEAFIEKIE